MNGTLDKGDRLEPKKLKSLVFLGLTLMSQPSAMPKTKSRVQVLVDKFSSSLGLPFQQLLPESFIADAVNEEKISLVL